MTNVVDDSDSESYDSASDSDYDPARNPLAAPVADTQAALGVQEHIFAHRLAEAEAEATYWRARMRARAELAYHLDDDDGAIYTH
jgi:hypothetical protein